MHTLPSWRIVIVVLANARPWCIVSTSIARGTSGRALRAKIVWSDFSSLPSTALVAYASDGFLIATAMRPHEGLSQADAHVRVSTTVLSQTITFHEPVDASGWLLLVHRSPYAGRGRSYGQADVWSGDRLVASYVQENMIRAFPEGAAPAAGERARH